MFRLAVLDIAFRRGQLIARVVELNAHVDTALAALPGRLVMPRITSA